MRERSPTESGEQSDCHCKVDAIPVCHGTRFLLGAARFFHVLVLQFKFYFFNSGMRDSE
jgi:hypothetical protein